MEKRSKHTEGKWKAQTDSEGFYWVDHITEDGGESICDMTNLNPEANARLIAAAPDLLKACKAARDFIDDPRRSADEDELFDILKVAIQKAEQEK
jgi:hypothetical protein